MQLSWPPATCAAFTVSCKACSAAFSAVPLHHGKKITHIAVCLLAGGALLACCSPLVAVYRHGGDRSGTYYYVAEAALTCVSSAEAPRR
jgi:hypothetical protein